MNPQNPVRSQMLPPTTEEIVARAHRIWIEAGRPEGRDREHWEEAERQLRAVKPAQPEESIGKQSSA
jgi:hypothetical protein